MIREPGCRCKGMTQMVSMTLFVVVALFLSLALYAGLSVIRGDVEKSYQNETERFGEIIGAEIRVESATSTEVYVRNAGSVIIPNYSIALYIDDVYTPFTLSGSIEPSQVGILSIAELPQKYYTIRASVGSGSGGASHSIYTFIYSSITATTSTSSTTTSSTSTSSSTSSTTTSTTPTTMFIPDLAIYLAFDEGSGLTAYDSSPNSNNGVLVNGPTWISGHEGTAVHFDGSDDYIDCGNSQTLNITGPLTIAAWVNASSAQELCAPDPESNAGVAGKVDGATGTTNWSWQMRFGAPDTCYLGFQFNNAGTGRWITTGQTLAPGKWYHVAATYNGSNITMYLNGYQMESNSLPSLRGYRNRLILGAEGWGMHFYGAIDDFRIYNRSLSASEISDLANLPVCSGTVSTNPVVLPSGPLQGQDFQISCPSSLSGIDCIRAYANGSLNQCSWSHWSGTDAVFDCTGMAAGSYTATCKTVVGSNSNCCPSSSSIAYTIIDSGGISDCMPLSTPNTEYFLSDNVSNGSTCFTVGANNITLDCQGYTINYSQSATGYGVYVNGFDNVTIRNCHILQGGTSTNSYAIYYNNGADNGIISNNNIATSGSSSYGIRLTSSSSNNLISNTITTSGISGSGMLITSSSSNNLISNTITTSNTIAYGIYLYMNTDSNTISNSTIASEQSYAMRFEENSGNVPENNIIYNCLLNGSSVPVSFNNIVASSAINYWNTSNALGSRTYSNGNLIGGNYYTNSSGTGFSDICADSNSDGFCDNDYNVSTNSACNGATCGNNVDYLPYSNKYSETSATEISDCYNLINENAVYLLTSDATSGGTCMNITANNVTLDCQGHMINYSQSSSGYGINNSGGYDRIKIRNCTVVQGGNSASSYAVYFYSSENNTIENNYIYTNSDSSTDYKYGIYLRSTVRTSVKNNTIRTFGDDYNYGLYLYSGSSNNISNNNITTSGSYGYGIYLYSSSGYNNLSNNNITTSGSYGYDIYISSGSNYNNLTQNLLSTRGAYSYGVLMDSASYNRLVSNAMNTSSFAVRVSGGSTTSYYDHTIDTTNTEQGEPIYYYFDRDSMTIENINNIGQLLVTASDNVVVRNITLDKDGIYFGYVQNSLVEKCSINTASFSGYSSYGIWLSSGSSNRINLNDVRTSGSYGHGIYFSSSSSNNVTQNNVTTTSSSAYGLYIESSDYFNIYENSVNAPSYASYVYSSDYGNLKRNNIRSTSSYGLYLRSSYYYNISENSINAASYATYLYSSNYGNFTANNITSSGSLGIRLYQSSNNNMKDQKITSSSYGIYFYRNSDSNTILNSTIRSSSYPIYLQHYSTYVPNNNLIYNCLLNGSSPYVYFYTGFPTDATGTNYWNTSRQAGTRIFSPGTEMGGNYYTNPSGTGYSDTCVDIDTDGFCDAPYAMLANNIDSIPLSNKYSPENLIDDCYDMGQEGALYKLTQDVSSGDTCMNILNHSITLDCQGHTITYATLSAGYGIRSNGFDQAEIKNCKIVQGSSSPTMSYGIYFENGANNGIISSNNITTSGQDSYGIYLFTDSSYNNVTNNLVSTSGTLGHGIHANSNSRYNNVTSNNITTSGSSARCVYVNSGSDYTKLMANIMYSSSSYGMYATNSDYMDIVENTIQSLSYGVYLSSSHQNDFTSNNITSTGSIGMRFTSSSFNTIRDQKIISQNYGLYLYYVSDGNIIANSTVKSSNSYAMRLDESGSDAPENNRIYNCLLNGSVIAVSFENAIAEGKTNYWNTTRQAGSRIFGPGTEIGGNYYTNSAGEGFSDNCADTNGDGFCDYNYAMGTNNQDMLPLSKSPGPGTVPWWSASWNYRQKINISNTAGNIADYQVLVNLTSSRVGSNWNWAGNGNDTRFVYYNCSTGSNSLLSHWIENWSSAQQTAHIWVNMPYLQNNMDTAIYMYYSNPSASNSSNGKATFDFYDDFNISSPFDSYLNRITGGCTGSACLTTDTMTVISNRSSSSYYTPPYGAFLDTGTTGFCGDAGLVEEITLPSTSADYVIEFHARTASSSWASWRGVAIEQAGYGYGPTSCGGGTFNNLSWLACSRKSAGSLLSCTARDPETGLSYTAPLIAESSSWTHVAGNLTRYAGETFNIRILVGDYSCQYCNMGDHYIDLWIDDIRIRKAVYPEPQNTYGSEESR